MTLFCIPKRLVVFWLLLLFFLSFKGVSQDTVKLADYIYKYKDFSLATHHALEACKRPRVSFLEIPRGTHHYYPEKAYETYCRISNNTNGLKPVAFPIIGQQDLTILGNGAHIMMHGTMMGAIIHKSANITLQNISFDWAKPFYVQGEVTAVDSLNSSYELTLEANENFQVTNNDLIIEREEGRYYIGSNYWFDNVTKAPVYNLEKRMHRHWNPYEEPRYRLERLDARTIRVTNTVDGLPELGWHFIAKWRNKPNINRLAPGIHIQDSKKITIHIVAIHSAAGMGIIGEKSEDITLENVEVVPTPNSDRIVSTTADATHFVNCKGKVILKNCNFQACLDDGLNIHGNYATVQGVVNDTTLIAEIVHNQQRGFVFAGVGDTLRIIDPETLLPVHDAFVVESTHYINDGFVQISTTQKLPEALKGFGLDNISWTASLEMSGCRIARNWARGVLLKTAGQLLVTDNYISSSMSGIRNWGEMHFFNESGNVTDVTITKNTFKNVCRVGNGHPVIVIFPQIKDRNGIGEKGYYNRNITISENIFSTFDNGILFAQSVDGLRFVNNVIEQTRDYKPLFPEKPTIEVFGCDHVEISGNKYKGDTLAKIKMDTATVRSYSVKRNKGFAKNW